MRSYTLLAKMYALGELSSYSRRTEAGIPSGRAGSDARADGPNAVVRLKGRTGEVAVVLRGTEQKTAIHPPGSTSVNLFNSRVRTYGAQGVLKHHSCFVAFF